MGKFKLLYCLFLLSACSGEDQSGKVVSKSVESEETANVLYRVPAGDAYEMGDVCGYINQNGDTIIPAGKYSICYKDTISNFGIVLERNGGKASPIAIDAKGSKLYEVYWFDNGPDQAADGLFRILKESKIGYADETTGEIVIEPKYQCAGSFEEGKARVAINCEMRSDGEHTAMESNEWIFINTKGEAVK